MKDTRESVIYIPKNQRYTEGLLLVTRDRSTAVVLITDTEVY